MLEHDDWTMIASSAFGVIVVSISALVRWISHHSHRLTILETQATGFRDILVDIRQSQQRIEDKLDRKADK